MNNVPRLLSPELLAQLDCKLEEVGAPVTKLWRPGLGDDQMDAITAELGLSLSTEARVWWAWHDGIDHERSPMHSSFGPGWDAYPLAHAVDDAIANREIAAEETEDDPEFHNSDWPDSWIALCGNVSYPRLVCECAVPSGEPSSVHYFDPVGNMDPRRPRLASVGELVHLWLDALDDGTWHIDPATGDFAVVDAETLQAKGPDAADLL
jgi:hypothetical protein